MSDRREAPPAGHLYIGYVPGGTANKVIVASTTSRLWPATGALPAGARLFDREEAERLNQSRPFMLRMDVLGKLPTTEAWFPDLGLSGRGVVAVAPARSRDELTGLAPYLVRRRRNPIRTRGP
jgi:hypothetical protein